jgi:hypothetical protein
LIVFFLLQMPTLTNKSSTASSLGQSRLVSSAMYDFHSGLLDSSLLIPVIQCLIKRSHCSRPVPCLFAASHRLGNLPDVVPHCIVCLLGCQATLLGLHPHGFWCPLVR